MVRLRRIGTVRAAIRNAGRLRDRAVGRKFADLSRRTRLITIMVVVMASSLPATLLQPHVAHALSVGPNNPTAATSTAGTGTTWTSPTNIYSSNGTYASVSVASTSTSYNLNASGFGFSIPTNATIKGVQVEVEEYAGTSSKAAIEDNNVQLMKAGAATGTSQATTATWPSANTYVTYGSSTSLWGATLAPSDVNATNFGVTISAKNVKLSGGGSSLTAYVDHVRVTVSYLPPAPVFTQSDYHWYSNQDSVQPGSSLAAENTSASVPGSTPVQLRMGVDVGTNPLTASTYNFKLQHATSTAGPWTDVSPAGTGTAELTDDFTGTNGAYWNSSKWLPGAAPAGSSATIQNNTGQLLSGSGSAYTSAAFASAVANLPAQQDFDMTASFVLPATADGTTFVLRGDSTLSTGYFAYLANDHYVVKYCTNQGNTCTNAGGAAQINTTMTAGVSYSLRFDVIGSNIRAREWPTGSTEPTTWDLNTTDTSLTGTGYAGFANTMANSTPFIVDNVTITNGQTSTAWQYYNNPTPADGTTVTTALLSGTPTAESYTESNPTAINPNAVAVGGRGEWDFALDDSYAASGTTYYFRMVLSDGTTFGSYTAYPQIAVAPPTLTQSSYRWYNNADATQPGTAMTAESTSTSITTPGTPVRLRAGVSVANNPLAVGKKSFKLQQATSTSGPWTDVGASDGWYNAAWADRRQITFNNSASTENLTNIPVLVTLTTSNMTYANAQSAGQDIRFTDSDGVTSLPYEIETWNPSGTSQIWVKVPQINASSTTDSIFMYYGNPSATDAQNKTAVWSDNFSSVWHLGENPAGTAPQFKDSTTSANDGTAQSMTSASTVAGVMGNGITLNGSSSYVSTTTQYNDPENITAEAWFNTTAASGHPILDFVTNATGTTNTNNDRILYVGTDGKLYFATYNGTSINDAVSSTTYNDGAWHYAAAAIDKSNGQLSLYIDGALVSTVSMPTAGANTGYWRIGSWNASAFPSAADGYFQGSVDEVRISSVVRSANWISAQYKSMKNTFASYGSQQTSVSTATSWRYYNNPTPTDGTTLTTPLLSGTPTAESYTESNPTASNPNAVATGGLGEWDFALDSSGASTGTTYYFRMVASDGTVLNNYTTYPQLTVGVTNSPPNSPASLGQTKTDSTTIATGGWTNQSSVVFTALASSPMPSAMLQLCVEAEPIATAFVGSGDTCGTAVSYSGTAIPVSVNIPGFTDGTGYHWQARIKDANSLYSSWVSYGGNAESAADFQVDSSPPTGGTVYDGTTTGVDASFNDGSLSALSANWSGVNTNVSGLAGYEYSIGTSAGATDVKGWTSNGTATAATVSGLNLHTSSKYFFNVRSTDNAGNTAVISSDGQFVAPSVSFSVSPSVVTFANLNAGDAYTDTKTTTLNTSTNAYGGYVIRNLTSAILQSKNGKTIPDFTGGTYAAPDSWQPGDTGFGYTSSDTSVQGVNKFQSPTCPGGSALAAPGCFAPFSHTMPGDIVADDTNSVSGTPITNEQFTITYRITTASTQPATTYNASAVYSVTPIY